MTIECTLCEHSIVYGTGIPVPFCFPNSLVAVCKQILCSHKNLFTDSYEGSAISCAKEAAQSHTTLYSSSNAPV